MLADLQRVYSTAGAKAPASDMSALVDALDGDDEQDFDAYLSDLKSRMQAPRDAAQTANPKAHIAALNNAGLDDKKFGLAIAALEADKSIKVADLDKIGIAYTMSPRFSKLYKSRAAKLKQIRETFRNKQEFESRGKVIDELLPWQ